MATESAKAADAYAAYRDLGSSRSLAKVIDCGKSAANLRQLEYWSSQFSWVERAKQWDEEQRETERQQRLAEEDEKRRKREAEIEAMNERHASIGVTQQKLAIEQLQRLAKDKAIGPYAAVQLLKLATDVERLARGEATERTEQQQSGAIQVQVMYVNDWRQNSIDDTPPDAPSGAESGAKSSQAIQLAQRRKKMA